MTPASIRPRGSFAHWPLLLLVAVLTFGAYEYILSYWTFGPEFAGYWYFFHGVPFQRVVERYTWFHLPWYRPTAFVLFYWIGERFFDWHNILAWKAFNLSTAVGCSFLIYWLVQVLFGRQLLGGMFAALYFLLHPTLYVVVFEISAFDFTHTFFGLLTVITYVLASRAKGTRSLLLTAAALASYILALTSKEITVVTPVMLAFASALELVRNRERKPAVWTREFLRLLPFFALLVAYWWIHIRHIPADWGTSAASDYRRVVNFRMIFENVVKYPMWLLRIFTFTGDRTGHAAEYATITNSLAGLLLAATSLWGLAKALRRDLSLIWPYLLLLGFIAVFLIVPVYSGGYLWHANLALAGYSALFGFGFGQALDAIPQYRWRITAVALVLAGFFVLARVNVNQFLHGDGRRSIYRMIYYLIDKPPLPAARMKGTPLVLVEDAKEMGWWAYGGGSGLVRYIYDNPKIQERITPRLDTVPVQTCQEWMRRPDAYYLRYDHLYRWFDASAEFRQHCTVLMTPKPAPAQPKAVAVKAGSRS